MLASVCFDAALFKPFLSDDAQVNPGRYGAELAFWLARALALRGVETSYPEYEDWGWFLDYEIDDTASYRLCCGNEEDSDTRWHCVVEARKRGWFGRHASTPEGAGALIDALRAVLEGEPGIENIHWD